MQAIEVSQGSKYTNEERLEAISHYAVLGNMVKVSELTGISERTLSDWKNKSDWWEPALQEVRTLKQDEIDSSLTRIIHKSTEALEDRIDKGDAYVTKSGEVDRKPMSGRDLATVTGIIFDKRQISRNLPTSIKSESTDARLTSLADKVRELQGGMVTIEGEVVKDK